ncbi:hypothetical protein ACP70R_012071 [Stipagrostis hirtigluma subsp. patula]
MAGSWRSLVVAVMMVSLVVAMVAASSMKPVAAAEGKPACRITEGDVTSVVESVRKSNKATEKACKSTVSKVKGMGGDCLCELRRRVQSHFDSNKDMFMCISPPDIARCNKTCIITERTVDHVVEEIRSESSGKLSVLRNTVDRVKAMGDDCYCDLSSRVETKLGYSVDDILGAGPKTVSHCRKTKKERCSFSRGDVSLIVEAIRTNSDFKHRAVCDGTAPRVKATGDTCLCDLRAAVQEKFDDNIDRFLCQPLGYLSRCPKTGKEPLCDPLSKNDTLTCIVSAVGALAARGQPMSTDGPCCSKFSKLGDACACTMRDNLETAFRRSVLDLDMDKVFCVQSSDCRRKP